MAKQPLPSIEQIRQLLDYDPGTGELRWKARPLHFFNGPVVDLRQAAWRRWNNRYAETLAGARTADGYLTIKINDISYPGHRLIWVIVHGEWPDCIDHINGNPGDNRLENLRSVSRLLNQRNQKRHSTNTSGRTGVSWSRFSNKWVAAIWGNQPKYLGSFDDFDEAVAAREAEERLRGFTGRQ